MEAKMITIGEAKKRIKNDPELSRLLIRSEWRDIALDLSGNGYADICFHSGKMSGKIDTFALDLTGNGEYNLYLYDTDANGIPDTVIKVDDDGVEQAVVFGGEVEQGFVDLSSKIARLLMAEEYMQDELGVSLDEMAAYLKENAAIIIERLESGPEA